MEKAKLELIKTKKGDFVANIIFLNGKKQPLSDFKLKDSSLNGKEVEVLREKGQIIKIICDGKEIYSKGSSSSKQKSMQKQSQSSTPSPIPGNIYSRAPYNFIPLNNTVVPAEEIPEFNKYHSNRYTGYIELEIKTLTPFYIRDTLTEKEYREKIRLEQKSKQDDKGQYTNPHFFSPGGLLRIPGSSLRGMIRTMVEIISFGKFGFFEDARLYYRGLADISSLRKEYQRHMSSFDKNSKTTQYKMSAGILHKKGFHYFITPSKGFKQILKHKAKEIIKKIGEEYKEFRYYKVSNGYIVVSGTMNNKKRDWLIEFPDKNAKEFQIPEEDILNYKNDKFRSKDVPNLLDLAKDGVPCFYTRYKDTNGRERISFGHTGMFRLAYEKTIGDHIPSNLKDSNVTDIAEAIFGNEKTHASRVFFEDAYFEGNPEEALLKTAIPEILSGPKPTCFQHYLEQAEENLQNHPKNLAHYNSDNPIRGYKLYWHRSGNNWEAEEISYDKEKFDKFLETFKFKKEDFAQYIIKKDTLKKENKIRIDIKSLPEDLKEKILKSIGVFENQHTVITPVREGVIFRGRIRFENLSAVELGALLFAIDLPEGLAHKLGMGKPLGLGSVRITPKLYLSNRQKRYSDLFAEWDKLEEKTAKIPTFKKDFENYILKNLGNHETSLWDIPRMNELWRMLDFNNKPNDNKTEYLHLEEFKKRKVLPSPSKV